ncbi:MAG TPA: hypothetical protein PLY36_07630 [Spirochaetota bacterium]|nr:hypothetical protein [Spirochaetota bacterium]
MKRFTIALIYLMLLQSSSCVNTNLEGAMKQVTNECDTDYIEKSIIRVFKDGNSDKLVSLLDKEYYFSFEGEDSEEPLNEFKLLLFNNDYLKKRWGKKRNKYPYTFKYIIDEVVIKKRINFYKWISNSYYDKQKKKNINNIIMELNYEGYNYSIHVSCDGKQFSIFRFEIGNELIDKK